MPVITKICQNADIMSLVDQQNINQCYNWDNDIVTIIKYNWVEAVRYLLDRKVNIPTKKNYILKWAARNGHLDIIKYLFEQGANIHADDDLALSWAAKYGHLDVVKFLVEQGADIHARDDYAVRLASEKGHLEIVKYFVEKGADIHAVNNCAVRLASEKGHLEIVKYFVEQGVDIHANDDYALRWAARNGHLEVVKYLVEQGANIHADDDLALSWAVEYGYLDIVKYLIARQNARFDYSDIWEIAKRYDQIEILNYLQKQYKKERTTNVKGNEHSLVSVELPQETQLTVGGLEPGQWAECLGSMRGRVIWRSLDPNSDVIYDFNNNQHYHLSDQQVAHSPVKLLPNYSIVKINIAQNKE
jgi:ankyrin repeat protein